MLNYLESSTKKIQNLRKTHKQLVKKFKKKGQNGINNGNSFDLFFIPQQF